MIGIKIAVLDTDRAYLEGLQAYLIRKKDMFFQILPYSAVEDYVHSNKSVDALLVIGDLWDEATGKRTGVKEILLHEGWVPTSAEGTFTVAKYQSADSLFKQLAAIFWKDNSGEDKIQFAKPARLIGVYSPSHVDTQILVTMAMAGILGEREKVLYVNLMEHSGFYGMTGVAAKENVGDLLYGMQNIEADFTVGLHSVRGTCLNFDFIPPVLNPEHLAETPKNLYEKLFQELRHNSGYDTVLIDFGRIFLGFAESLTLLEKLYCVGKTGRLNRYAMEEFEAYLDKTMNCENKKIEKIILPEAFGQFGQWDGLNAMESYIYGENSNYIRGYLYGDTKSEN